MEELERRRRKKNVIWRGLDGEDQEERRALLERFMEVVLDRKVGIVESTEVKGEDGRMLVVVEMKEERDKKELLEKGRMMWRRWEVRIDEDLTGKERRIRWLVIERVKVERGKGREVEVREKRMWVDGKEWIWNEKRERLKEKRERGEWERRTRRGIREGEGNRSEYRGAGENKEMKKRYGREEKEK